MDNANTPSRRPMTWVPTLYFAEGLPLYVVIMLAGLMYKSMGVANDQIARWTGIITLAWAVKPLWSPLLEAARSKKSMVVLFQVIGGVTLLSLALTLQMPAYFAISVALFGVIALVSATHDIAADGLYIASLSGRQQTIYAGWQGGFYNTAKFIAVGPLVILAGILEQKLSTPLAWTIVFGILGALLLILALYHSWALPQANNPERKDHSLYGAFLTLREVIVDFFKKPGIWLAILFIILFRAGEAQVTTIAQLFLRDARSVGGLGLTTAETGALYGIAGTLAFIAGSVVGGYFAAWLGLRRAMFFLVLGMNLPNLAFFFLSTAMPTEYPVIAGAIFVENFGFGFGFVGIILYIMQVVSVGKYQTAHYAFGTGFMALGLTLFKTISGDVQVALGYQHFFLWVLVSAIPVLLMSLWIVPKGTGSQPELTDAADTSKPPEAAAA
ncbi:MAG: MFS transporter [Burkholderiaceae bacterium]|nr:MFS transporter [Burkholderiaceae bacterium]